MLGIDLGKNSCSVAGLDAAGKVVLLRRMQPKTIVSFASKLPACVIAMEACCGAHHLGRLLANLGHEVRLMSPEYVRPYVKAHKNDDRDAEAIAEAATRPTMRFVQLKSQEQLDVQSLHRVRSRLVGARTNLTNQLRAILLERGTTIAQGRRKLEHVVDMQLADPNFMANSRIRRLVAEMREEWSDLDRRIEALDREFIELARDNEAAHRLVEHPDADGLAADANRQQVSGFGVREIDGNFGRADLVVARQTLAKGRQFLRVPCSPAVSATHEPVPRALFAFRLAPRCLAIPGDVENLLSAATCLSCDAMTDANGADASGQSGWFGARKIGLGPNGRGSRHSVGGRPS